MSLLVISGTHEAPAGFLGWESIWRGTFETVEAVVQVSALRLAAGDDWLEVIETTRWRVMQHLRSQHPECRVCKGKGHISTWLNSVGADKIMKPMQHRFACIKCDGKGWLRDEPKIWVSNA